MKKFVAIFFVFAFALWTLGGSSTASAAEKAIKWRLQSSHDAGTERYPIFKKWLEDVKKATGGRLDIALFPPGGIVKPFDSFEAVSKGVMEAHQSYPAYWRGIDTAMSLFCNVPFGLGGADYLNWYYGFGGLDIMRKAYAKYNIHVVGVFGYGTELHYFKTPINSLNDFKGKKARYSSTAADLMKELGVAVVMLPGGEVYTALATGTIDGTDFGDLKTNYDLGFHEITKYIIAPGFHEPVSMGEICVNMNAWKKLPDDLKTLMEMSVKAMAVDINARMEVTSAQALIKFKEKGMTITRLPEEDLAKIQAVAAKLEEEKWSKTPLGKEVLDSLRKYRELTGPMNKMLRMGEGFSK
jgi:TRAP-type mannitol/chloroaromatic compound transport system substrate-binding protein